MADQTPSRAAPQKDYPIPIRDADLSVSVSGDLLITGPPTERIRRWLVNYPEFYIKSVVPFIRAREPSFQPNELWIDSHARIHITNRAIVQRMKQHLSSSRAGGGGGKGNS